MFIVTFRVLTQVNSFSGLIWMLFEAILRAQRCVPSCSRSRERVLGEREHEEREKAKERENTDRVRRERTERKRENEQREREREGESLEREFVIQSFRFKKQNDQKRN